MSEHNAENDAAAYVVACPRCGSAPGDPCTVRKCRQGILGCTYAVCSVVLDLPAPHSARAARAAVPRVTSPGVDQ